ncbi:hypothetical protein CJ030_MR3G025379 [Morella rubra]|uniref:Uncharacterized protein n=1 Tax=Morella rubra TaxID=262757 RepID=A0A6A1WDK3_9ROSI|nr:hypothetical protein CJ030_MR3G025379 [Morella rubra]
MSVFHCCHLFDEDWNVGRGLIPISVNKWVDVRAEVKEYIRIECWTTSTLYTRQGREDGIKTDNGTSNAPNRMHAYFKKFPSKEAALLKPHPDTTEEQWKELCDLFTSEPFMKRSEQNKKNRSKLTVNHAAGSRSFQRTQACMKNQESGEINPAELYKKNYTNKDAFGPQKEAREIYERMDAFQRKCDLEGKTYTEIELQLAKARDEIEAMRAAREKDLQEFAKKQAEMEATLRDHHNVDGAGGSADGAEANGASAEAAKD